MNEHCTIASICNMQQLDGINIIPITYKWANDKLDI